MVVAKLIYNNQRGGNAYIFVYIAWHLIIWLHSKFIKNIITEEQPWINRDSHADSFFSREPGSRQQIDLNLFGTWGQTAIAHAYFIENIIMFIPFGLLAPMVFKRMRKVRFCVFIGFLCSCGIELSQLITQRGYCQLDDVVTNTVGMLVGWGIWKLLSSVGMAENPLF